MWWQWLLQHIQRNGFYMSIEEKRKACKLSFQIHSIKGTNKASISQRSDYGYGCLLTTYDKIEVSDYSD